MCIYAKDMTYTHGHMHGRTVLQVRSLWSSLTMYSMSLALWCRLHEGIMEVGPRKTCTLRPRHGAVNAE